MQVLNFAGLMELLEIMLFETKGEKNLKRI